ncbi:GNAT family N-acetyltransferase [Actinoplanes sp. NPDC051861]|uniref:GNAT family N-acetyltransferase n=1 Tax=Actinoplanes sp. NPDC051861 TaxID=3155170 RepID=UPI003415196B
MTTGTVRYLIRPGRPSDAAELADLQASVQLQRVTGGKPHPGIAAWVHDLLDGHPSVTPDDFLVAEDPATGRPVASLVSLRQDWALTGVRLPVAQIELVGTAPEHRGNRLTEQLFAALHQRHAADGVAIQMIEGIPYFYRRLGYDYALANDGAPTLPAAELPPRGDAGDFSMRPATAADAYALADLDRLLAADDVWTCPRDVAVWQYEIAGRRAADFVRRAVAVLVSGTDVVAYLVYGNRLSTAGDVFVVAAGALRPEDWPVAAPVMHAYLGQAGREFEAAEGRPFTAVRFLLDPRHPLVLHGPHGVPQRPRGWYVRAADPIGLLTRLQPALRARWQAAGLRWPEPELTIDTYGRAARLEFEDGTLKAVHAVPGEVSPPTSPSVHAAIPPAALLQLLLGHRDLPGLLDHWPDCLLRDRRTEEFLTAAFPTVPVHLWTRT